MLGKIERKIKTFRDIVLLKYQKDIHYTIGQYDVVLPYRHNLPIFQQRHSRYDKFLPHIAKYLPDGSFVVDVGANCADTFAGMFSENPSINFICVEADDFFFKYLEKNVKSVLSFAQQKSDVRLVKCLAGASLADVVMEGQGGTKHAVSADVSSKSALKAVSLDEIVASENVRTSQISMLKTDTDGFDYDVIVSAHELTIHSSPLIFFECQYENTDQISSYKQMLAELKSKCYTNWTIFDNFGSILISTSNVEDVFSLMDYVWEQNCGNATRTIYYLDILACKDASLKLVQKCISEYS